MTSLAEPYSPDLSRASRLACWGPRVTDIGSLLRMGCFFILFPMPHDVTLSYRFPDSTVALQLRRGKSPRASSSINNLTGLLRSHAPLGVEDGQKIRNHQCLLSTIQRSACRT